MSDATNPLAAGTATSEGKITIISVAVGLLVMLLGAIDPVLQHASVVYPNSSWLPIAKLVTGAILAVGASFGYSKSRALVKSTQISALLASGVPVVVEELANAFLRSQGKPAMEPGTVSVAAGTATLEVGSPMPTPASSSSSARP